MAGILVVWTFQCLSCAEYTNWIPALSNIPLEAICIIQSLTVAAEHCLTWKQNASFTWTFIFTSVVNHIYFFPPLFFFFFLLERGNKMGRRGEGGGEVSGRIVSKAPLIKPGLMRLPMNGNDNERWWAAGLCLLVNYLAGIYISSIGLLHNRPKCYNKRRHHKNE